MWIELHSGNQRISRICFLHRSSLLQFLVLFQRKSRVLLQMVYVFHKVQCLLDQWTNSKAICKVCAECAFMEQRVPSVWGSSQTLAPTQCPHPHVHATYHKLPFLLSVAFFFSLSDDWYLLTLLLYPNVCGAFYVSLLHLQLIQNQIQSLSQN